MKIARMCNCSRFVLYLKSPKEKLEKANTSTDTFLNNYLFMENQ